MDNFIDFTMLLKFNDAGCPPEHVNCNPGDTSPGTECILSSGVCNGENECTSLFDESPNICSKYQLQPISIVS